jgi:RNA polymerase sigma factor (sigma-70 family)
MDEIQMKNTEKMSDSELIHKLREDTSSAECLLELISRHSGIYMTMVNNYTPGISSSIPSFKNELISDKNYYIYQAALKYDDSRNTKFSTYLGNETRWMCLNLYNKNKNQSFREIFLDQPEIKQISEEDSDQKIVSKEFLDKVISIIDDYRDKRVSKIFKMRYINASTNKVTPWKQIGDSLNLSIQGCINIHNKTISKIKKELSKDI